MKKLKNLIILSAFLLVNIFALNAATEVATIADAKKLASDTKINFTGELTLQYVSQYGENYYAFDANNDFVRLSCFYWATLTEKLTLSQGDKIKIAEEVTFVSDENNCVTFSITSKAVKTITCVGSGDIQDPIVTTIADLKNDIDKNYGAKFVKLCGVGIESISDFENAIFIKKIYFGNDSIDYLMDLEEFNFPSVADVSGFVCYENGNPKLFIPQIDGYVEASAYDNIAGLKMLTEQEPYENISFKATVLVTYVKEMANNVVYYVQKNDETGNPSAMQIVVSKSHNLDFQVGDSVAFDVVGTYESSYYEVGTLNKMKSATFNVDVVNETKIFSRENSFNTISFRDVFTENGWIKYDNCLTITSKGEVVLDDKFTSIGCIGLKLKNEVLNTYETIAVVDTYYKEVGSPSTLIVRGFVCGLEVNGESYAVLLPRSKADFLKDLVEFDDIASMKEAGKSPTIDISYKLKSDMTITGFALEKFDVGTFYHIFVQDATGALQLNHQSAEIQKKYKVGDVITNVVGYYTTGGKTYSKDNSVYYASAPALDVKTIEASDAQYVVTPVEVSLADLDDSYASKLVKIKNVTYNSADKVMLNGEEIEKPTINQGKNWTIVSDEYEYATEMGSVTGVYYLSGVLTKLIPRSQADIVVAGYQKPVAVENVLVDNNLFVQNNVIYADGATIEVYDVMGRLLVMGNNFIDLSALSSSIIIVRTEYVNKAQFITKMVNK